MSPSSNGIEFDQPSYLFSLTEPNQIGEVRRFGLVLCANLNFDEIQKGRVAIIINELAGNLIKYGTQSKIIFRNFSNQSEKGIEILAVDSGPGLDEVQAMQDGFSTGDTPGTGLGAIKRQSDLFDIYSQKEKGTIIVARVSNGRPLEKNEKIPLEIGAITIPYPGEIISGDAWSVNENDDGFAMTMMDGLGHGPKANAAAMKALNIFREFTRAPVDELLTKMHAGLRQTRGAAGFVLSVIGNSISYVGAGNIHAVIQKAHHTKTLISQNGTIGLLLGSVKPNQEDWNQEGYLILHSDGIGSRWDLSQYPGIFNKHPSILAAILYRDFQRGSDDATVVVVRRIL